MLRCHRITVQPWHDQQSRRWCAGIPVEKVSADETERLVNMESVLHGRVIGQEEAVVAIARAIRRARVGLKNPNRPIASFIFSGPTGPTLLRC